MGGWCSRLEWQCVILTSESINDAVLTHQCPRPLGPPTPWKALGRSLVYSVPRMFLTLAISPRVLVHFRGESTM